MMYTKAALSYPGSSLGTHCLQGSAFSSAGAGRFVATVDIREAEPRCQCVPRLEPGYEAKCITLKLWGFGPIPHFFLYTLAFLFSLVGLSLSSFAFESPQTSPSAVSQIERGITGTHTFTYDGPTLRVRTQRDADAPLIVRLKRTNDNAYEANFIGTREGEFDLSQALHHVDGSLATLPSMPVRVISTLPNDQRSDLFQAIDFEPTLGGGYRLVMLIAAALWLFVPAAIFAWRWLRQPPAVAEEPPVPVPTWGQRLEPLVTAAVNRPLSAEEKRQLELLLLHYWRERSGADALEMAASIRELRQHPEAGPLVRNIEAWLHRSAGQDGEAALLSGRSPAAVVQLLEPFRVQLAQAESEAESVAQSQAATGGAR